MSVYIMSSFDAKRSNELILQGKVTMMSAVSTMVQQIIQQLKQPYPPSFRCMLVGGGMLFRNRYCIRVLIGIYLYIKHMV